jgi:hypothetical protein
VAREAMTAVGADLAVMVYGVGHTTL